MISIIIDSNNRFVAELCKKLNNVDNCNSEEKGYCLPNCAAKIRWEYPVNGQNDKIALDDIFFINCELKLNGFRQDFNGINYLKWLRMTGVNNHCILYSFLPLVKIVKSNPLNSVLLSKGVTFLQAPFSLPNLNDKKYKELAERENLLPFFRGEIDLKKIRHELANYYGLKKLINAHKLISKNFESLTLADSYNGKLFDWLFDNSLHTKKVDYDFGKVSSQIEKIRKKSPKIIYLDDKAHIGWSRLLKDILGGDFTEIPLIKSDTEITLFEKFIRIQKNLPVDLFICDLKLKDDETDINDYTKLVSYKLVQKIRTRNAKQKILYLTATNDLNKYKGILKNYKYNPQIIFTKEGLDQMYTEQQSFENYSEFIYALNLLFDSEHGLKKVHSLQLLNILRANEMKAISDRIDTILQNASIINSKFEYCEFVVFDTNAFMNGEESLELFKHIYNYHQKTVIHKAVYEEIRRFANFEKNETDKPIAYMLANFFLKYFDDIRFPTIDDCMDDEEKERLKDGILGKDFADKILIRLVEKMAGSSKIIFVSNDRATGIRKNSSEIDGPIPYLNNWIDSTNNRNLTLYSLKDFLQVGSINYLRSGKNDRKNKNRILKITLSNTGKSFNFSLDNSIVFSFPKSLFVNKTMSEVEAKVLNMSISFLDKSDFERQMLLMLK